jgi:hypothetical protein
MSNNTQLTPGTIAYAVDDSSRTCTAIQIVSQSCQDLDPFSHGPQENACVINACSNPSFGLGTPGEFDSGCTPTYPVLIQFDPKSVKLSCPSGYTNQ